MHAFNQTIQINGRDAIGPNLRPYVIAEMACAHDGSLEKAKAITKAAAQAGADAVQLQFLSARDLVVPGHSVADVLNKIEFTAEQWREVFDYGRSLDIDVWACTYDVPSVKLAIELGVDGIKLNSSDLSNPEVLRGVAASGIPFTLGTGASTMEEIARALRICAEENARDIVLMYGVQNFPTLISNLNIARLGLLSDVFGMPVGYADHTDADLPFAGMVDLLAVGQGACLLEKHICMDRVTTETDFQAALEPHEYEQYVDTVKTGWQAFGSREIREFSESDINYRRFQKKSVVAARNLTAGTTIDRNSVLFIRAVEEGIAPAQFNLVDGKTLKQDVQQFDVILPGYTA